MPLKLLNILLKILRNYLLCKSKILGNRYIESNIAKKIAIPENTPNNIVGLKFEKRKTRKPKIIVNPVIRIALPADRSVFFSSFSFKYLQAKCIA